MKSLTWALAVLSLSTITHAGGCAKYEYQLVDPPQLAQRIGQQERRVEREPLVYHLQTYENRLIMRVENPTAEPIELLGNQSAAVDPNGQSHPLRSQTIMPGSFIKLVLPPLQPNIHPVQPTFGIGVQVNSHLATPCDGEIPQTDREEWRPVYADVYSDVDPGYWEWNGEATARITLVYQRSGKNFWDGFVFHRVKAK